MFLLEFCLCKAQHKYVHHGLVVNHVCSTALQRRNDSLNLALHFETFYFKLSFAQGCFRIGTGLRCIYELEITLSSQVLAYPDLAGPKDWTFHL